MVVGSRDREGAVRYGERGRCEDRAMEGEGRKDAQDVINVHDGVPWPERTYYKNIEHKVLLKKH